MNGDVVHSGNEDFTLLNGILSNEYATNPVGQNITSSYQNYFVYHFNAYGAYTNNKIKLNCEQIMGDRIINKTIYYYHYNNTFTFTLPLILKGNYTFDYVPYNNISNTFVNTSDASNMSITLDMNSNTVSIPVNKTLYTKEKADKGYLKIIRITKN